MALPLIVLGVAAGGSLLGGILQGVGQKQQAEAEADAARANARMLRQRAREVAEQGKRQAGVVRMQGSKTIDAQRVAWTASGVDATSGTPAALAADSRIMAELDALNVQRNANLEAKAMKQQARQLGKNAKAAHRAGNWAMGGSIVGGIGGAAGMAYSGGLFGKTA